MQPWVSLLHISFVTHARCFLQGSHMQYTNGSGFVYDALVGLCGSKGPLPNKVRLSAVTCI